MHRNVIILDNIRYKTNSFYVKIGKHATTKKKVNLDEVWLLKLYLKIIIGYKSIL